MLPLKDELFHESMLSTDAETLSEELDFSNILRNEKKSSHSNIRINESNILMASKGKHRKVIKNV